MCLETLQLAFGSVKKLNEWRKSIERDRAETWEDMGLFKWLFAKIKILRSG